MTVNEAGISMTLEEIRVDIDEIILAGDHGKVRLRTSISRDDFDIAVPGNLGQNKRREWIDHHAGALADLMVKKYERGQSHKRFHSTPPVPVEHVIISSADLQSL